MPKKASKEVQQCIASNPYWYVTTKLLAQKLAQKSYMF
jgi:hypothetical protein